MTFTEELISLEQRLQEQQCTPHALLHLDVRLLLEPSVESYYEKLHRNLSHAIEFPPTWQESFADSYSRVQKNLQESFNVCLHAKAIEKWEIPSMHATTNEALDDIESPYHPIDGITLGFCGCEHRNGDHIGLAYHGLGAAVLKIRLHWDRLCLHELGHVFDAVHVDDTRSFMSKTYSPNEEYWDEKNRGIIIEYIAKLRGWQTTMELAKVCIAVGSMLLFLGYATHLKW